jgi:hypothetical protein
VLDGSLMLGPAHVRHLIQSTVTLVKPGYHPTLCVAQSIEEGPYAFDLDCAHRKIVDTSQQPRLEGDP